MEVAHNLGSVEGSQMLVPREVDFVTTLYYPHETSKSRQIYIGLSRMYQSKIYLNISNGNREMMLAT